MSSEKTPKKVKVTFLKLTVANGETVVPGQNAEVDSHDASRFIHHGQAKKYEAGDEKTYEYKRASSAAKTSEKK